MFALGHQIHHAQILLGFQVQAAEQRVICATAPEGLRQGFQNAFGHVLHIRRHAEFYQQVDELFLLAECFGADVFDRCRIEQVSTQRHRWVELLGVKVVHTFIEIFGHQRSVHRFAQGDQIAGEAGILHQIKGRMHHAVKHACIQPHGLNQLEPPFTYFGRVGQTGQTGVDPIGCNGIRAIPGEFGFAVGAIGGWCVLRGHPQRHQQVVAHRPLKDRWPRMRRSDPPRNHSLMQIIDVVPRQDDLAAHRDDLSGEHLRQRCAFTGARGLYGDAGFGRDRKGNIFENGIPVGVAHSHVAQLYRAVQVGQRCGLSVKELFLDHARGREPLHHHLPAQRHILHLIVIGQKLAPGA